MAATTQHHPTLHSIKLFCTFVLSSMALLFVGCKTQQGVKDNSIATISDEERSERKAAMIARQRGDYFAEEMAWRRLVQNHPNGRYAGLAHFHIGRLSHRSRAWTSAKRHFQLALRKPLAARFRQAAQLMQGEVFYELKEYRRALTQLKGVYERVSGTQKRWALGLLIKSSDALRQFDQAYRWRVQRYQAATTKNRPLYRKELVTFIKTKLSKPTIQKLLKPAHDPTQFPYVTLHARLAQPWLPPQKLTQHTTTPKQAKRTASTKAPAQLLSQDMRSYEKQGKREKPGARYTIGVIYPMTGRGEMLAPWIRNALIMASQKYPRLQIVYKNSGSRPAQAAAAVRDLVQKHNVLGILGPVLSKPSLAAAKQAQALHVSLYSLSIREKLTELGPYVFRNNLTLSQASQAIARYAVKTLKVRRFGIFSSKDNYGRTQAHAFQKEVKRLGAKVTAQQSYNPKKRRYKKPMRSLLGKTYDNRTSLRRSMTRGMKAYQRKRLRRKYRESLKPTPPFEALFIPETARNISMIAPHLNYFNIRTKYISRNREYASSKTHFKRVQLLGSASWYHKKLFRTGYKHVSGAILCKRYYPRSPNKRVKRFLRRYRDLYNKAPIHLSAYAYDSLHILAKIALKPEVRTRYQFRQALSQVKAHRGITGLQHIDETGETVAPLHYLRVSGRSFSLLQKPSADDDNG